ncbi:MAG: hypothetical protein ACREQO_05200 [Candidatus Binatia bacterium]
MRIVIFFGGIALTILGWLFARVIQARWLLMLVTPDYVKGMTVLNELASNEKFVATVKRPGVRVLLNVWPGLADKGHVESIQRSVAYMVFGPNVKDDIDLIARDNDENEVGGKWTYSEARKVLIASRDKRLFWIGTLVFFAGMAITVTTGWLEFIRK